MSVVVTSVPFLQVQLVRACGVHLPPPAGQAGMDSSEGQCGNPCALLLQEDGH